MKNANRSRARGAAPRSRRRSGGFTLVELIVVMLIITVLAGVTLPVASKMFDREASKATRAEMKNLAEGVRNYFGDTGALPSASADLVVDSGVAGWTGPYVSGGVASASAAAGDFDQDGWSVPYRVTIAGDTWTLTSSGPDRARGTADDLVMAVEVTPDRRGETIERLSVINLSIRLYNEDWHSPPLPAIADPLSNVWATARTQLISRGYLANAPEYATDAWGDDFVRVGTAGPVVAVESANIGS